MKWDEMTPARIIGGQGGEEDFRQMLKSAGPFLKFGLPIIIALWLLSGIYIVGPDEQGVVRRFGKEVRIVGPGPHYALPRPIEVVNKPKVTETKRLEVGFRTVYAGPPARYRFYPEESLMLTGDENIIDAQIIVQYKIKDASAYLFNVRDLEGPSGTLRDAAEVALRQVIGRSKIDDVLTVGKFKVEADAKELLQEIMDEYDSGLLISEVKLQTVRPPKEVSSAFDDVVRAKEDKDKYVKQAEGYAESIIPGARGKSESLIREAEAYKSQRVSRSQGDADRFLSILKEYEKAPDVTRRRLYLETMEEILPGIKKFIIDKEAGGGLLQLLPLEERGKIK